MTHRCLMILLCNICDERWYCLCNIGNMNKVYYFHNFYWYLFRTVIILLAFCKVLGYCNKATPHATLMLQCQGATGLRYDGGKFCLRWHLSGGVLKRGLCFCWFFAFSELLCIKLLFRFKILLQCIVFKQIYLYRLQFLISKSALLIML